MNLELNEIKLMLGTMVLEIAARDKALEQLTNELNALKQEKVREFPREVENVSNVPSVDEG